MKESIRNPLEPAIPDPVEALALDLQQALHYGERLELAGKHSEAEQFYRGLLQRHPRHAPLLHSLALLLRERGELGEAELLLRRAKAAAPEDAALRNSLGAVLQAAGKPAEAEAAYRGALALAGGVAELHYNLGTLLEEQGRNPEALAEYQAAVALEPRYARAWTRIGAIRLQQGAAAEALADLDRAVAASPRYFDAHYYRGGVLSSLGRHEEALQALHSADQLRPGSIEAVLATANALRDAGQFEQALSAYWHLLELQPERLETHQELNRLAWSTGYHELYLRSYAYARQRLGPSPELLLSEAGFRLRRNEYGAAEELLWPARRLAPQNGEIMGLLGQALAGQKKYEEAYALYTGAIAAEPAAMQHRYLMAFALLQDGQPGEALDLLEQARGIAPLDQLVLAGQALAYRELGDSRYHELFNPAAYIKSYDLPPPSGFADAAAYNRALAQELDALHTRQVEPVDQTLRGGTQTPGYLFASATPLLRELVGSVRAAVSDYIRGLPQNPAHPMSRQPGGGAEVDFAGSWSCRLASRGYHSNHVHPMGWISSAYYVRLPQGMDDAQQRQGWLKFGESNLALGERDRPDRYVEPRVGRLVLFPSFFWHGTVPFSDGGDRLSIAFDAVPNGASGGAA